MKVQIVLQIWQTNPCPWYMIGFINIPFHQGHIRSRIKHSHLFISFSTNSVTIKGKILSKNSNSIWSFNGLPSARDYRHWRVRRVRCMKPYLWSQSNNLAIDPLLSHLKSQMEQPYHWPSIYIVVMSSLYYCIAVIQLKWKGNLHVVNKEKNEHITTYASCTLKMISFGEWWLV